MNILRKDYTKLYFTNPNTRQTYEMTRNQIIHEVIEPAGGSNYNIIEVQYFFTRAAMPKTGIKTQASYLEELLINRFIQTNGKYPVCAYRTDPRSSYQDYEWPNDPYLEPRDFVLQTAYLDNGIHTYNFYHTSDTEQPYSIIVDPELQNIFQKNRPMKGKTTKKRVWQKDHADFRDFVFRLGSLFTDFSSYYELTERGYEAWQGN